MNVCKFRPTNYLFMEAPINRLIIIGNGFDLAHNSKTKFSDFIDKTYAVL